MRIAPLLSLLSISLIFSPLAAAQVETKPTILVPAEKCPEYTNLVQRYFTSVSKRTGILGCHKLYDERLRLLSSMLAYGQNSSCYSTGWKGSEVVSFLQNLINRNLAEKLRCEAWLASGRVCQDGNVCPPQTICNAERACVAKPTEAPIDPGAKKR